MKGKINYRDKLLATPRDTLFKFTSLLILADGRFFFGQGAGKEGEVSGEICFNTSITGYQEILTDPSYAGQIITFTFPHIGNVGCNKDDIEARKVFASGLVLRESITEPSNFRSTSHLAKWLEENNLTAITGIDTRALTRHIRLTGAKPAIIYYNKRGLDDLRTGGLEKLFDKVATLKDLSGLDLASKVTTEHTYEWNEGQWKLQVPSSQFPVPSKNTNNENRVLASSRPRVIAIDFGEKLNILRCLVDVGCDVQVVGAKATAEEIMKLNPDGIFLSNGPADPSATFEYAGTTLKKLVDSGIPIFGICLGFQLLALTIGAKTKKMHQGHRGANHPVKNLETGMVEITSQNHGFEVLAESLPKNAVVTHKSLFDGCLEGFKLTDKPVFAVQYHPEASPGPHDSFYLFENFVKMMSGKWQVASGKKERFA